MGKPFSNNTSFFYCDSRNHAVVGDDKQAENYPQVKILNLDNEFNYSLRLDEERTFGNKQSFNKYDTKQFKDERSFLENDNIKNECYTTSELFEWLIYIKKKPISDKIYFTINNKDIDFIYQGELTEQEIKEGSFRPDELIGSFALYCPKSGHVINKSHNYMCGKIGHIPSPYFLDEKGNKIKAKMYIEKDVLIIEIPDSLLGWDYFLNPLTLDPEFGYTTAGASEAAASSCISMAGSSYRLTASTGDAIVSLHMSGRSTSGTTYYKYAIYNFSTVPVTKQMTEVQIDMNSSTKQWWAGSYTYNLTNATVYVTAQSGRSGAAAMVNYDIGSGEQRASHSASALPATWTNAGWSAALYSNYATYENTGGTSAIKKYFGATQATLKKVNSVAIASVKKLTGVANT